MRSIRLFITRVSSQFSEILEINYKYTGCIWYSSQLWILIQLTIYFNDSCKWYSANVVLLFMLLWITHLNEMKRNYKTWWTPIRKHFTRFVVNVKRKCLVSPYWYSKFWLEVCATYFILYNDITWRTLEILVFYFTYRGVVWGDRWDWDRSNPKLRYHVICFTRCKFSNAHRNVPQHEWMEAKYSNRISISKPKTDLCVNFQRNFEVEVIIKFLNSSQ